MRPTLNQWEREMSEPVYSKNPLTIEEMEQILFVLRCVAKDITNPMLIKHVATAKYALKDAIERR